MTISRQPKRPELAKRREGPTLGNAEKAMTTGAWNSECSELGAQDSAVLIFHLRRARNKARDAATAEVVSLLADLQPRLLPGGPLSEQGGLFWIACPMSLLSRLESRLPRLGYTTAVDLVQPIAEGNQESTPTSLSEERRVRWKRRDHRIIRLYEENSEVIREMSPDRREFLLETSEGQVRMVRGYRGDSRPLGRRGLPVYDAKLLVNLVYRPQLGTLLDPFAGVGGIVIEASAGGWSPVSCDLDPMLRFGLAALSTRHLVGDASKLPVRAESVQAIATEPPYSKDVASLLPEVLAEMYRVLQPGGRLAILAASWQAGIVRAKALALRFRIFLDTPINRKGVDVVAMAWEK